MEFGQPQFHFGVPQGRMERPENLGQMVWMARTEAMARREVPAELQDLKVHEVNKEFKVHKEFKEWQVPLVQLVQPARQAKLD